MTDYAMFANARMFAHIKHGELAAKTGTAAADALRRMSLGEHVIPLFDSTPTRGEDELRGLGLLCDELGLDPEGLLNEYAGLTGDRTGDVPYILTVSATPQERVLGGDTLVWVTIEVDVLPNALNAGEFLRLRALGDTIASQFKGSAPARTIQEGTRALTSSVRAAAAGDGDEATLFRRFTLVEAQSVETAYELLSAADREPRDGDMVFLVTRATMLGLTMADTAGQLGQPNQPIARGPEDIKALLIDAQRKATPNDPFNAAPAIAATDELIGLLNTDDKIKIVDDYAAFYEFRLLSRAVTQAIDLAKRPLPADFPTALETDAGIDNRDTAAALQGLSVEAVLAELPEGFAIERSVVAAAVASLRAGKHLLLGGPPGTGKTTLAEALCRAVVATNYDVTTATADWTTFDTIGGYLPDENGLRFVPGIVLRSLRTAGWLVIDEVNRADIDKAFGPLFTLLSGGEGVSGRTVVLPYTTSDGKPVTIEWASSHTADEGVYSITPSWRLLGTLNVSDKSSLFRMSFAFLRRFSVIDVPLPAADDYRALFQHWFSALGREDTTEFVEVAMAIADGPISIGPAIGRDFAQFVVEGLADTASGTPTFINEREALLTAARLLVAPQYEGQPPDVGQQLLARLDEVLDTSGVAARYSLATALREVALS